MDVFIRVNSQLARLAAMGIGKTNAAIVVRRTIYLWGTSRAEFLQDRQWVRHEVVHVLQYQKYGVLLFWYLYLVDSIKKGYLPNKFEQEARNFEKDRKILDGITFR